MQPHAGVILRCQWKSQTKIRISFSTSSFCVKYPMTSRSSTGQPSRPSKTARAFPHTGIPSRLRLRQAAATPELAGTDLCVVWVLFKTLLSLPGNFGFAPNPPVRTDTLFQAFRITWDLNSSRPSSGSPTLTSLLLPAKPLYFQNLGTGCKWSENRTLSTIDNSVVRLRTGTRRQGYRKRYITDGRCSASWMNRREKHTNLN